MPSFETEPVMYVAAANAILLLLASFGLPVSSDQKVAIDGVIGLVVVPATFFFIARAKVTPTAKLPVPLDEVPHA